jgi:RES domain-containing protein
VYASERLSLAVLEVLVHVEPNTVPPDLMSYEIEIPDNLRTTTIPNDVLPPEWQDKPSHPASRALGDAWLARGDTVALRVPSAIVPGEMNVLINPRHQDARVIIVVRMLPFQFDLRLVRE